jgi:NAD(P)H-hydrate epimerase
VATGPTKVGSITQPARAKSGRPIETDIGLPEKFLSELPGRILLAEDEAASVPLRPADGHKGTFGKVLIVAGCRAYRGAAALACLGAARAGAGMVSLASIEPVIAATAARISSVTYENLVDFNGSIAAANAEAVAGSIDAADAAVIGPGLGRNRETDEFVRSLISAMPADKRLVVDADALNACAPAEGPLAACKASLVVTPHPGEMGRLLGSSTGDVQENRLASALEAAKVLGQVVVLKGAGSIVAEPDGSYAISPLAVPSLSHAGSGDVLAGVIGSLLAQGLDPAPAARLGVVIHTLAGQRVGEKFGPAGAIADDLPDAIPGVIESLRAGRAG